MRVGVSRVDLMVLSRDSLMGRGVLDVVRYASPGGRDCMIDGLDGLCRTRMDKDWLRWRSMSIRPSIRPSARPTPIINCLDVVRRWMVVLHVVVHLLYVRRRGNLVVLGMSTCGDVVLHRVVSMVHRLGQHHLMGALVTPSGVHHVILRGRLLHAPVSTRNVRSVAGIDQVDVL
mmetsp:Transcript_11368/g.22511  ORF Transcript_11368/g.22511 Transcript_11368/m.22511 type:complete len:174 (-) Transcript_11368:1528-2049(-)